MKGIKDITGIVINSKIVCVRQKRNGAPHEIFAWKKLFYVWFMQMTCEKKDILCNITKECTQGKFKVGTYTYSQTFIDFLTKGKTKLKPTEIYSLGKTTTIFSTRENSLSNFFMSGNTTNFRRSSSCDASVLGQSRGPIANPIHPR